MSNFTPQQVVDYLLGESGTFSERKSARMAAELIEQQQAEINALKAHVERLLKACQSAHSSYGKTLLSDPPQDAWKANQVTAKLVEAIASTPKQSLAEHDAEVARVAILAVAQAIRHDFKNIYRQGIKGWANDYANKIKAGDL